MRIFANEEHGMFDVNMTEPPICTCVDCGRGDILCGGLWKGFGYTSRDLKTKDVHIVVSHCKESLRWISDFTAGCNNIVSMHVLTKCREPVEGAPDFAEFISLPNKGRCDHSYVSYILNYMEERINPDAIIFFLKDTLPWKPNSFEVMLESASSARGFACGIAHKDIQRIGQGSYDLSLFHKTNDIMKFSIGGYSSQRRYGADDTNFKSGFTNLGDFYNQTLGPLLDTTLPELMPVCYRGNFAASVSNIRKVSRKVWEALEMSLSRGNNIEEGHFAERLWGILLATPLRPYQITALWNHAGHNVLNLSTIGITGVLGIQGNLSAGERPTQ